jgi:hypothetical protein
LILAGHSIQEESIVAKIIPTFSDEPTGAVGIAIVNAEKREMKTAYWESSGIL